MKTHDDYFESTTRCLMTFQYIEEVLKMILMRLESLVHFRIKEFTPYDLKPKFSSIRNAAMGRLIDMLKIYCDDDDLISELKRLKKHRDILVHQGLLMTYEEIHDKESIHSKSVDLEKLNEDGKEILSKVLARFGELDTTLNKITAEQDDSGNG